MSRISDLAGFTTALSTTEDLSVGIISASSFSGNLTGNVIGNVTGNLTGTATSASNLVGQPDLAVNSFIAVAATFSGNVSVGGTLTYQDVTNIDSVGVITAQQGIQVLANGISVSGFGTFNSILKANDKINVDGAIAQAFGAAAITYSVTVVTKDTSHRYNGQGSSLGYLIDGLQSPFITLTPGRTYQFHQAESSNNTHQIRFYYQADRTTLYETGVTYNGTAGSSGAYTQIVVSDETPAVLHYQCVNHSLMGNAVQTNSNPIVGAGITLNADHGGIDIVGVVTAASFSGSGIKVLADGADIVGVTTTKGGLTTQKTLKEEVEINANSLSADGNIYLESGMVHYRSGNLGATVPAYIKYSASKNLNDDMAVGESVTATIIQATNNASYFINGIFIDGTEITNENWIGGSAPSDGGASGVDIYTFNIIKTAANTYTVIGNQTKTS